jgi:hypothetical protein
MAKTFNISIDGETSRPVTVDETSTGVFAVTLNDTGSSYTVVAEEVDTSSVTMHIDTVEPNTDDTESNDSDDTDESNDDTNTDTDGE